MSMHDGLLLALIGLAVPLLAILLRRAAREPQPNDAEALEIFTGTRGDCGKCVDLLADAGIAAWIEQRERDWAVAVDRAQAEDIPHLLPAQRQGHGLRIPTPRLG